MTVHVGPGVFIPRPETESMLEWAVAQPLPPQPVIVDLCTGSGALALALSQYWPDRPRRRRRRLRGRAGLRPAQRCGNARSNSSEPTSLRPTVAAELDGGVDLVVANPPYIPDGATLEPEVAEHDPPHALFGGPDGMAVIDAIVELAARWLRDGGRCAVEHDDTTSARTVDAFASVGRFNDITARHDLTGRPRFVTATRSRSGGDIQPGVDEKLAV